MKQGTLSFTSTKRTNSIPNPKRSSATEKRRSKKPEIPVQSQSDAKLGEVHEISSDEVGPAAVQVVSVPAKRTRASTKTRPSFRTGERLSEEQKPSPREVEREQLDVEDKAGRYHIYHNEVRSKLGYSQPIHSEGQNKIHQILRFFDMSYEFGPCIGMTRLERWERAEALGLNPPVEVRDILLTKEGVESVEYAQCVLYNAV